MGMTEGKILLVEDDPSAARLAQYTLQQEGYEVVVATEGRPGLEIALNDEEGFDLVVLDLMLPDMDGTEVSAALRGNPDTADIPIMMFTARASEEDRFAGLTFAGADAYLAKPADPGELVEMARQLLRRPLRTA